MISLALGSNFDNIYLFVAFYISALLCNKRQISRLGLGRLRKAANFPPFILEVTFSVNCGARRAEPRRAIEQQKSERATVKEDGFITNKKHPLLKDHETSESASEGRLLNGSG